MFAKHLTLTATLFLLSTAGFAMEQVPEVAVELTNLDEDLSDQEESLLNAIANGNFEATLAPQDLQLFTRSQNMGRRALWTLRMGLPTVAFTYFGCLSYIKAGAGDFDWTIVAIATLAFFAATVQYFATGCFPDWRSDLANAGQNRIGRIRLDFAALAHKLARLKWSLDAAKRGRARALLARLTIHALQRFETWAGARTEIDPLDIAAARSLQVLLDPSSPDSFGVSTTLRLAQFLFGRVPLLNQVTDL